MSYVYRPLYKCRLCNKLFVFGEGHSESDMLGRLCRCINQANGIIRYRDAPYPVNLYDMHYCANGNRGVADFVGFKRVNADE